MENDFAQQLLEQFSISANDLKDAIRSLREADSELATELAILDFMRVLEELEWLGLLREG